MNVKMDERHVKYSFYLIDYAALMKFDDVDWINATTVPFSVF